jgi:hypothetical protein
MDRFSAALLLLLAVNAAFTVADSLSVNGGTTNIGERRIIVPVAAGVREHVELDLMRKFGGYTLTRGTGAWIDPTGLIFNELVYVYDVATSDRGQDDLLDTASLICRLSTEQSVYVRLAYNDVVFYSCDKVQKAQCVSVA